MDIKIESTKVVHPQINAEYFKNELLKKYGDYKFITNCHLKFGYDEKEFNQISMMIDLKNGGQKFVSHSDENMNKAFRSALSKLDKMIDKYKIKHFHN